MLADQVQLHYYYNSLTPHGSQDIRIHVYPAKGYKSKHAHLLSVLRFLDSDGFLFSLIVSHQS